MREIKFRGKDTRTGLWVYGFLTEVFKGSELVAMARHDVTTAIKQDAMWKSIEVDPITVGQFTGLKDNEGKDIYEGDRWRWKKGTGYVTMSDGEFKCTPIFSVYSMLPELEVIGNIHDNPDMVGET